MSTELEAVTLDGLAPAPPRRTRKPRAKKPVAQWSVIAFGATWCAPWSLLAPVLDDLADDGIPVQRHDVDVDAATAERYRIITLPTLLLLRDGTERRRITGAVSAAELRGFMGR